MDEQRQNTEDDDVNKGKKRGVDVDSVTHNSRDEAKQPGGTVLRPDDQSEHGQRSEAAEQRRGPRYGQEHENLATAEDVEMMERPADGEVLDHREPEHLERREAEHCHHCDDSKRQRDVTTNRTR